MFRVNINTELCSCHFNSSHLFKAISGQLIYVCCILILLVQKFSQRDSASRIELCCKDLIAIFFCNFGKKNESQENFVRHLLANIAKIARMTNITKL